jgi:hypothetical protein
MNKNQKALILQSLIAESNLGYWGREKVSEYLRELKDLGFADIKVTYDKAMRKNRIFDWISTADPKLELFFKKNQDAERSRKQTSELLTLPAEIVEEIQKRVDDMENIPYDPFKAGSWQKPEIVYLKNDRKNVEIWLAHKVGKPESERTNWSDLPEDVKNVLSQKIEKNDLDTIEFNSIALEYNIFGRVINLINFNLETKQASIKSDEKKYFDPEDNEEKRINPEERFNETLQSAFKSIGLSLDEATTKDVRSNKRINKNSVGKIHALENKDHLILPFRFDFLFERGNTSERTRDEFFRITTLMLKPKVIDYYTNHATFSGFFEANRDLDVENNGILLKRLRDEDNIQSMGNGFFIFIAESEGKIISARIICNIASGSMRILPEKNQKEEDYERINQELDRLFP